jgi:DUF1680 family protein
MRRIFLLLLLLLVSKGAFCSNHSMHPEKQIDFVKQQIKQQNEPYYAAYLQLLHYADSLQAIPQHALVDFAVPGFYDKPKEHQANSLAIQYDAFGAYCSALAYRLSGEKKYGEKACYFLNAWSQTNQKYSEHDGVLVMAYSGSGLLIAAELMQDTKIWKKNDKKRFEKWVSSVYQKAVNEIRVHKNNWADWGRFGSLLAASFLNDKKEIQENVRLIQSDLFDKIAPDGSMPEETKRGNNGIWYTYFSLAPMTAASWLVYNLTGENLFFLKKNNTSMKKALDYLAYYNLHPAEWTWHEKPNTGEKDSWPNNLLEAMAGIYHDENYVAIVKDSRPLIYHKHHFAWVFPTLMPASLPTSSTIHLSGYLGDKIDACIKNRVLKQDVHLLLQVFYDKTETHRWQSEFLGKWMLGAISAYRYTNDATLLDSIQVAVNGLLESQSPNGYIGNYAEKAQLQEWDIWGRKYSMLGLLSYFDLTGDSKVLQACCRMADHLMTQTGAGKTDIVATGNYRGMASCSILQPIVLLYNRTGDARYLNFAEYIVKQLEDATQLLRKAETGIAVAERFPHPQSIGESWFSRYNGQKAYEMMSCYEGLLELYQVTGNPTYLSATEKAVQNIIDTEINIAGSGSAFECWYHGKALQTQPTYHTMETCVTMTWMKLCLTLLSLTKNSRYADQIEFSAYNALLASMKNDASQIAKYSPLEGHRHPGEEQCGMPINCCNANGPRAFMLLPEFAVMKSSDTDFLINLYADWNKEIQLPNGKSVYLTQTTDYPADGIVKLKIKTDEAETFALSFRIPSWSRNHSIRLNGETVDEIVSGSYYTLNRTWHNGDVVNLNLDVSGRISRQNGYSAIRKGPLVLARDTRFQDGFIDETCQIANTDNAVELISISDKPKDIWLAFTAPLILGTDLEGEGKHPKAIRFCDFSSAGNTWAEEVRYRVWLPETLNVMQTHYQPYNNP